MILNFSSLCFNADLSGGGGTPAWGTELGQGEGYKFSFENMSEFLMGMLYKSVPDLDEVFCPLGKGGNQRADYDFVVASVFDKVFVNGKRVNDARFLLLIIKKITGDFHIGRKTLKYNPRMTYRGEYLNEDCYRKMEKTMGITDNAAWYVYSIDIINQDELHFTAYILGEQPKYYDSIEDRKRDMMSKLPKNGNYDVKYNLKNILPNYFPFLTALRTKPFLLLAGISGTGKSRIAREIAKACWDAETDEGKTQREKQVSDNFCMIQVKPNWHDSTELLGYVSRIGEPHYVTGDFLPFIAKAWEHPEMPYILCLDEMNLAPVEQYFAEYLSVIESRKAHEDGTITTDPIVRKNKDDWYRVLTAELTNDDALRSQFLEDGICLPQNLFVIGTVNMDETTFSFSRKVLDRAMTIEMNEVDLMGGLDANNTNDLGYIGNSLLGTAVEGKDVYATNKDLCDKVIAYLQEVNEVLEGTPFKIAYRTRNEFLLYAVNRQIIAKQSELWQTIDEMTSMKILSRIEGDSDRCAAVLQSLLGVLQKHIENGEQSISIKKIKEMQRKLASGYTSYWA